MTSSCHDNESLTFCNRIVDFSNFRLNFANKDSCLPSTLIHAKMKVLHSALIVGAVLSCLPGTCYSKPELQLLSVIFRHGDRTPNAEAIFPTDPNYHNDFFPIGHGGLTNSGKLRMYKLGEFLREKYQNFLGDVYYPELVSARSTDYARTKMSLQLALASLFRPSYLEKWHEMLDWQPVPFSYVPIPRDDLLATTSKPRYLAEKTRVAMLPDIQARFRNLSEFMSQLTKLTGKNISGSFDITQIYDTLLSEDMMNLSLPSWAADMFPDGKLSEAALLFYDIITYDTNVTESVAGGSSVANNHRSNINWMLYLSAVIIELWKEVDAYYVKVLYYLGNSTVLELQLPGCPDVLCSFDKFTSNVKDILELAERRETKLKF
ncbi:venom acid phosphatase Acph-1-like isoform X2 [Phymastichus coffea]|uniref:venom acid phosphatase Acph-1-like isoform X2 n=1 Tax=Phymastichus coffea TaxID=108790 RepID=UPI00273C7D5E|nr:venom acid phosphatase Acph-1-like isoform X2 [Phymastichus coffea]